MSTSQIFDPTTGVYVELTADNAAQVAPQIAASYGGIPRDMPVTRGLTPASPQPAQPALSPFVHPGGRRELRATLASRETKTYYKAGNERLGGMSTMPVRRAKASQ